MGGGAGGAAGGGRTRRRMCSAGLNTRRTSDVRHSQMCCSAAVFALVSPRRLSCLGRVVAGAIVQSRERVEVGSITRSELGPTVSAVQLGVGGRVARANSRALFHHQFRCCTNWLERNPWHRTVAFQFRVP